MANELKWCKGHFEKYSGRYKTFSRYYSGDQPLPFISKKVRSTFGAIFLDFCDNMCKPIIDIYSSKIILNDFLCDDDNIQNIINDIYKKNKIGLESNRIHVEAIKMGDAYAIVWFNNLGEPTIYPQETENIAVRYEDDGTGNKIVEAIKCWETMLNDQEIIRITRYLPNQIERYYYNKTKKFPYSIFELTPWREDGQDYIIDNPFNYVPIFHFSNNTNPSDFAASELKGSIPLQNALNNSHISMLVAGEFVQLPQRYATGLEIETDAQNQAIEKYKASIDRMWVSSDKDTKFGQFDSADLRQFIDIQDNYRNQICRISSTPSHLFNSSGNFPSGESLRVANEPMTRKVISIEKIFSDTWEQLIKFVLKLKNINTDNVDITVIWQNTEPKSETVEANVALIKNEIGVSKSQLLSEMGYSTEEIEKMREENLADKSNVADAVISSFNSGV